MTLKQENDQLALAYDEYQIISTIVKHLFDLKILSTSNKEFTIKQNWEQLLGVQWPNYKCVELESLVPNNSVKVYAYKFIKHRPELYLMFNEKHEFQVLDEKRFNAYATYKKPDWEVLYA